MANASRASGRAKSRQYAKRNTPGAHQAPRPWPRFTKPPEGENVGAALELLRPSA